MHFFVSPVDMADTDSLTKECLPLKDWKGKTHACLQQKSVTIFLKFSQAPFQLRNSAAWKSLEQTSLFISLQAKIRKPVWLSHCSLRVWCYRFILVMKKNICVEWPHITSNETVDLWAVRVYYSTSVGTHWVAPLDKKLHDWFGIKP